MNMKALKGEEMTWTDAEACAYLYTASLTAPMDSGWLEQVPECLLTSVPNCYTFVD
jgi:hypothetical protein